MVVENAFARLKGRWQSLLKRMDYYDIQHTTNAIASCMVLHNIYEQLGDACQPEWIHTDSEAPVAPAGTPAAMTTNVGSSNANTIRHALKQYVTRHEKIGLMCTKCTPSYYSTYFNLYTSYTNSVNCVK